jgi:hypothetical protein
MVVSRPEVFIRSVSFFLRARGIYAVLRAIPITQEGGTPLLLRIDFEDALEFGTERHGCMYLMARCRSLFRKSGEATLLKRG